MGISVRGAGGYAKNGRGKENAKLERIWFSPSCLKPKKMQPSLFEETE
jgi:hypothetical protein